MDLNRPEPGGRAHEAGDEAGNGKDRANAEREEATSGHAAQGERAPYAEDVDAGEWRRSWQFHA